MRWVLVVVLCLVASSGEAFDFVISTTHCDSAPYVHRYAVYKNNPSADYSIMISMYNSPRSLKVNVVNSPKEADIIFTDGMRDADVFLCREAGQYAEKIVSIDNYLSRNTKHVQITKLTSHADVKLYYNSRKFSLNEAIALVSAFLKIGE